MTYSFEKYLIKIGQQLPNYTYSVDLVEDNIDYFKDCYENNLSEYKALEWFNFHLEDKNLSHKDI